MKGPLEDPDFFLKWILDYYVGTLWRGLEVCLRYNKTKNILKVKHSINFYLSSILLGLINKIIKIPFFSPLFPSFVTCETAQQQLR